MDKSYVGMFNEIVKVLCHLVFGDVLEVFEATNDYWDDDDHVVCYCSVDEEKRLAEVKESLRQLPHEFFMIVQPSFNRVFEEDWVAGWGIDVILLGFAVHELRHRYQEKNPNLGLFQCDDFALERDDEGFDKPTEEDAYLIETICRLLWKEGAEKIKKNFGFIAEVIQWDKSQWDKSTF